MAQLITCALVSCFTLLCACLGPKAYVAAPTAAVVDYPTRQYDLPSGLRVVLERPPEVTRAGAVLLIGAGSIDDPAGRAGLAHLAEHLAFKGKGSDGTTLWDRLLALGAGNFNGLTSWDDTTYFAFAPRRNLPALLDAFAGLLRDPLAGIDEAAFQHEKGIVIEEMRLRDESSAQGQAMGWLTSAVLPPGHPYARPIGGTLASLREASLADVRAFMKTHYLPALATLVVTAPFAFETQSSMIERAFRLSNGPGRRVPPQTAPSGAEQLGIAPPAVALRSYRGPVATPELWIGWSVPGWAGARAEMPDLLAQLLMGVPQPPQGDVAGVDARVRPGVRNSLLYLRVVLKRGTDPAATARSVLFEAQRGLGMRLQGTSTWDFWRRFLATNETYAEEHAVSRAMHLARSAHFMGEPAFLRGAGPRLLSLTGDEVLAYARQYLGDDRARAILLLPLDQPSPDHAPAEAAPVNEKDALPVSRPLPPDPAIARSWMAPLPLAELKRVRLATGLEVMILPRPGELFHSVLLGFHGGQAPNGLRGIAQATRWAVSSRGALPSQSGISYSWGIDEDATTFLVRSTGSDLRLSLDLLLQRANLLQISWPPTNFGELLEVFDKNDSMAPQQLARSRARALFGTHPYGEQPTLAQVQRVSPNDVHDFAAAELRPENGLLVIVGNIDAGKAAGIATEAFAEFLSLSTAKPPVAAPAALLHTSGRGDWKVITQHQSGTSLVKVAFQCVLPPADARTLPIRDLFAEMLKLAWWDELREAAAETYSISGGASVLRGGTSVLQIEADLGYRDLAGALRTIRRYKDEASARMLDTQLLARARATLAREYNLTSSTTAQMAADIFARWNHGGLDDGADRYPDGVFAVELAQVLETSDYCRDNAVLTLLGDAPKIRTAWDGASSREVR